MRKSKQLTLLMDGHDQDCLFQSKTWIREEPDPQWIYKWVTIFIFLIVKCITILLYAQSYSNMMNGSRSCLLIWKENIVSYYLHGSGISNYLMYVMSRLIHSLPFSFELDIYKIFTVSATENFGRWFRSRSFPKTNTITFESPKMAFTDYEKRLVIRVIWLSNSTHCTSSAYRSLCQLVILSFCIKDEVY